ncbi:MULTISPECIES: transcriptional regulator TyrR [unclassified Vibrio]|uniref:HTH-type transcriptional regulatory protein TyrR n=1 Tax=Vibrio sp. HB236076 TaxID=3232307 RepID=A0AB39HAF7_9VIBR|nr:transcriptional regulator TyrR [Vibrio sp. HB161653]MDP5253496.1 transcriptional regulator TyrR [Vibrio sp. HB161653]
MRLEVICEDRLGLTRELLDLLVARAIDLRGIEIDQVGIIYLNCPDIDFDSFSALMGDIRRIDGVKDVRKIQFMPVERHNHELLALVNHLPEPVLAIDIKGHIDMANLAACALLKKSELELKGMPVQHALPQIEYGSWLEAPESRTRENIVLQGIDYVVELMPVHIENDHQQRTFASTLLTIRTQVTSVSPRAPVYPPSLGFEHFVGISNRHKALVNQAKKLAVLEQPLLIEGETGTGKEMLAKACHHRSERGSQPFLVVSCASMPDDVAETELFGHAPGSFNHEKGHKGIFELADGGTVYLDEIGEMSPHLQIKLLRFLQDGKFRRVGEEKEIEVDVRIIASTKHNLALLAEGDNFREDLYYRLNVLSISIPPLRTRPNDISPLLDLFVNKHSQKLSMAVPTYHPELLDTLMAYPWPGNMRQLDNMVLRALTQVEEGVLSCEHFHLPQVQQSEPSQFVIKDLDGGLDEIMKSYEAQILHSLYQNFPSSRKLAKRLNVSHTSIANKLREYNIKKVD